MPAEDVHPIGVTRAGRPEHTPEAELVLVVHDGPAIVFVLDDGERLEFDGLELRRAVGEAVPPHE